MEKLKYGSCLCLIRVNILSQYTDIGLGLFWHYKCLRFCSPRKMNRSQTFLVLQYFKFAGLFAVYSCETFQFNI